MPDAPAQSPNPPARKQPRIAKNVISNWIAFAFGVVVTFFLSPFVVHSIGNKAFGVWVLVVSMTGYLGFMDLGVRNAVTRYVSKFHALGEHESASSVVSSAFSIFSVSGLLAVGFALVVATFASRWFNIPADFQWQARVAFFLAGLNICIWLINGVFAGVVVGLQRFDLMNKTGIAIGIIRAGVIVFALNSGGGLITLSIIELGAVLSRCLCNVWWAFRLYPELRVRLSLGNRQVVGMIFSFSLFSFLLDVANDLIHYTDAVVIGAFLPVERITFFAIGANMRNYARGLVGGLSNALLPAASKMEAETQQNKLQHLVLNAVRFASLIIMAIAGTYMLRGRTFIDLWMGREYGELSGRVLWILSIALIFGACNQVSQSVVLGMSRHRAVVPVVVAEGLANLGLSILFVRSMGVVGVAWGAAIPSLAVSLLFWPWYMRRTLHIPMLQYAASAWLRPGMALIPFLMATFALEQFWIPKNLAIFFAQVAIVLPLAIAGFWYFCLDGSERTDYSLRIRSSLPLAWRRT